MLMKSRRYKILPVNSMFANIEWQFTPFADEEPLDQETINELVAKELVIEGWEEVDPVFHREGWYYDRIKKFSWHEYKGRAWTNNGDTRMFLYEIDKLNFRLLETPELKALKTLFVYGNLPPKVIQQLRCAYWDQSNYTMLRNTFRGTRKRAIKFWSEQDAN